MNDKPILRFQMNWNDKDIPVLKLSNYTNMSLEKLNDYKLLYEAALEGLAGKQIWKIIDAYQVINSTIRVKTKQNELKDLS